MSRGWEDSLRSNFYLMCTNCIFEGCCMLVQESGALRGHQYALHSSSHHRNCPLFHIIQLHIVNNL